MKKKSLFLSVSTAFVLLLTGSSIVGAQASRTWVSGLGDDTAACSRTAPCQTFAGALVKTAAGGEINVLDSAGFGTVTINKSITIAAEGVEASVLASGVNGIVIDAGPNDIVILRGLDIEGLGTGLSGISILSVGTVHIENCRIDGFRGSPGIGINVVPSSAAAVSTQIFIKDTIVRNNGVTVNAGGILIKPGANVTINAVLDNVLLENNSVFGIRAEDNSSVSIRNSTVAGTRTSGIVAFSVALATTVNIDHSATLNNGFGIRSDGLNTRVRIGQVTISGNGTGLSVVNGGQIISFGTNSNGGNGTDGAPTSVIPQQ